MPCPRCGDRKSWLLKDGRQRCARCRHDWKPARLPLRLTPRQWRALLRWFVRGMTSAQIAHETQLERKRILRALTLVRQAMLRTVPTGIHSTGAAAHGHEAARAGPAQSLPHRSAANGRRSAMLGLYAVDGQVWAEVVSNTDADTLGELLRDRKGDRALDWPALPQYAAVVYRGRLYRPADSGSQRAIPFGHIEGFWAYLQRQLRSKGGIRRQRLGLYLAEYAWRYNHRKLLPAARLRALLKLVSQGPAGVKSVTNPRTERLYDNRDNRVFH